MNSEKVGKVIRIDRLEPRGGIREEPYWSTKGYCLADPRHGAKKHHSEVAVYVRSLDEAAELVEKGYSLRMTGPGKRPSLVSPKGLCIIRS